VINDLGFGPGCLPSQLGCRGKEMEGGEWGVAYGVRHEETSFCGKKICFLCIWLTEKMIKIAI